MLLNQAFVPGKRYPLSRVQVGTTTIDAAEFELDDQLHVDRTFTSGWGGATRIDIKGYTVTGRIVAYVAKSVGYSPETVVSNLPARGALVRIKLWSGGFYAEGDAVILSRKPTVTGGKFVTIDISFESDGVWDVVPNVVEFV